ncbi:GUN4 domain-containing protein [Leptothoe sp. PORK10 BA2]|uniref:GUN4 domain-containing protein n=1 Tax=Leptothoe sp. PORK10 BA2 TaxID=3110254 RepID=UPI002B20AA7F|nr:GUN4 domain-containing protein [Leptothoe sp. PORK10 BA2]MEA5462501.1 GUN4 domain-containing protein [Leptothoe sp. PORK10 BA2]
MMIHGRQAIGLGLLVVGCLSACQGPWFVAGADYKPLTEQLQAQNWQAADALTLQLLLRGSDRVQEGWLAEADVVALDCSTLLTIDRLWTVHSQGRFGWSRQQQIWRAVGGGDYAPAMAIAFGERVGWRELSTPQWRSYEMLTFATDAPVGHLPATTGNGVSGAVWGGVATLGQRLQACQAPAMVTLLREDYYATCDRTPSADPCRLKAATERWGETADWGGVGLPQHLTELEQALAQHRWIAADNITRILFDHYRQAHWAEFGGTDGHQLIPCYLLTAIDSLWMDYSRGHFGLTAQAEILGDLKLLPAENHPLSREQMLVFYQAVGWPERPPDRFESPYQSAYDAVSPEQVPKGHYPYYMGYSFSTYGSGYDERWRWHLDQSCGFNSQIRG